MQIAAYVRVSTDDQNEQRQMHAIREKYDEQDNQIDWYCDLFSEALRDVVQECAEAIVNTACACDVFLPERVSTSEASEPDPADCPEHQLLAQKTDEVWQQAKPLVRCVRARLGTKLGDSRERFLVTARLHEDSGGEGRAQWPSLVLARYDARAHPDRFNPSLPDRRTLRGRNAGDAAEYHANDHRSRPTEWRTHREALGGHRRDQGLSIHWRRGGPRRRHPRIQGWKRVLPMGGAQNRRDGRAARPR